MQILSRSDVCIPKHFPSLHYFEGHCTYVTLADNDWCLRETRRKNVKSVRIKCKVGKYPLFDDFTLAFLYIGIILESIYVKKTDSKYFNMTFT